MINFIWKLISIMVVCGGFYKIKLNINVVDHLICTFLACAMGYNNNNEHRIIGGNITNIKNYQYMVCLVLLHIYDSRLSDLPYCGGSIIRRYWVLTAAHCLVKSPLFDRDVALRKEALAVRGNTSFCSTGEDRVDHIIKLYVLHPQYNSKGDYDIALLKVKQPFIGVNEKFVVLAPSSYRYTVDDDVLVMGWGITLEGIKITNQLRHVKLKIIGYDECYQMYQLVTQEREITPRMVCAGWRTGGKDSCGGDSGGPLVTTAHLQIGIVSWGHPICGGTTPGVYVRLPLFIKWISKEVDRNRNRRNFS